METLGIDEYDLPVIAGFKFSLHERIINQNPSSKPVYDTNVRVAIA